MKGLVKGIPKDFAYNFVGTIINFAIDPGVMGRDITFVFSPESITDSVSASYTQTVIPGSSAPQITYSATGARQLSFSLNLPLDYLPPNSAFRDFEDYLNAFRALVYPKYSSSGGKVESPHCKVTLPNIELDGVCTQCSIEYKTDRYASDGSMSASVGLSFIEILNEVNIADAKWIANSKVKVLKNTSVSGQSSGSSSAIQYQYDDNVGNGKCNLKLLGDRNANITSSSGLLAKCGWTEPGYTFNNKDKYTIKCLYGFSINAPITITNIHRESYGSWYANINGKERLLSTSMYFTESIFYKNGDTVYYCIVYVPMYDANKYEFDSAIIRYVNVKVVK